MSDTSCIDRVRPNAGEQLIVALQGERGSYGHLAAQQVWGGEFSVLPCRSFGDVITAVQGREAPYAVLPLHNDIVGEIADVRSSIQASGLEVVGEVRQEVRHCLLGTPGSSLDAIRSVFSHPAALAQCVAFLRQQPAIIPREAYDTAGAARDVAARGLYFEAAIADARCAERYGLQLLARDISDREDNSTVFAVVRRGAAG